ncbi:hypothetical protein RB653_005688 [Dictyostelium firmibasis]|uniref:GATA-type domain-containing protein n=1 Tax=Dictyostelium firmibasis TaxID=79012 RepID=A0AAN7UA01_9MYCE
MGRKINYPSINIDSKNLANVSSGEACASFFVGEGATSDASSVDIFFQGVSTEDSSASTTPTPITISTTTSSVKKRGRPTKKSPDRCFACKITNSPYWRKSLEGNSVVDLCNSCGLDYIKKYRKEKFSKERNNLCTERSLTKNSLNNTDYTSTNNFSNITIKDPILVEIILTTENLTLPPLIYDIINKDNKH